MLKSVAILPVLMGFVLSNAPTWAESADCQSQAGRRVVFLSGEIGGAHAFRQAVGPGWTFAIVPAEQGYEIRLFDKDGLDLTQITPPYYGVPNPRQLYGWHFRNADNTAPNDGSVNAPQEERLFLFSAALSGTGGFKPSSSNGPVEGDGRGWLKILDYGLADLAAGEQARMVYLKFSACLSWPGDVEQVDEEAHVTPENVEIFGKCGLKDPFALLPYLNPSVLEGDFDGDGSIDQVATIAREVDGKRALAFCLAGTWLHLVGLEGDLGHLTPAYFDRMDWWSLYPKREVHQGVAEGPPPTLVGDAVTIGMEEKSSVLLYWKGDGIDAYWQGD